jgi:hypothetical protein
MSSVSRPLRNNSIAREKSSPATRLVVDEGKPPPRYEHPYFLLTNTLSLFGRVTGTGGRADGMPSFLLFLGGCRSDGLSSFLLLDGGCPIDCFPFPCSRANHVARHGRRLISSSRPLPSLLLFLLRRTLAGGSNAPIFCHIVRLGLVGWRRLANLSSVFRSYNISPSST